MTQIRVPADVAKTDRSNTWTGTQDFTAATVLGVAGGGGGTVSGATAAAAGVVQLAGDLSGTYQAPTVPGLTGKADKAALAAVATTGAYGDLTGRPALAPVATTGAYGDLTGRPALAPVATTGAYGDLSGRPALATVATTGAYGDLSGRPAIPTAPLAAIKAADTTRISTVTVTDDPDLVLTNVPAGNYQLDCLVRFTQVAFVPQLWLAPSGGAAVVGVGLLTYVDNYSTTPASMAFGSGKQAASTTASAATFTGSLYFPSVSSVALRWAQTTSDSRNTTVQAGSYLRLTRVG